MHIIVVHALIDVAMVVIAVTSNRDITMAEDLFATGMIGGQMLLLASWLGFSESRTRNKVSAFTVGCMFLSTVAIICTGATQGGFNQSSPEWH